MAGCFMNMNNFEKALQLFQEVEEVQLKTLGPFHPEQLKMEDSMENCLLKIKTA